MIACPPAPVTPLAAAAEIVSTGGGIHDYESTATRMTSGKGGGGVRLAFS